MTAAAPAREGVDARLMGLGVASLAACSFLDSLRGPLLPFLAERFSLSYGRTALFMSSGMCGSLALTLAADRLLVRLGERAFLLLATAAMSAALLGAALGGSFGAVVASGALWGAGISAIGLTSSLLVVEGSAPGSRGRALSALHVAFGLCSVLPPLYLNRARALGWGWEVTLLAPAALMLGLGAAAWVFSPRRAEGGSAAASPRRPGLLAPASALALYVMGEVLASTWMVSYLRWRGLPAPAAARILSLFFLGLGVSRALAAWLARSGAERVLPAASLALAVACLSAGMLGRPWALALAGFMMGPVFPMQVAAISLARPDRTRATVSLVYALYTAGLVLAHPLLGILADRWSPQAAYAAPALFLLASLAVLRGVPAASAP